MTRALEIAQQNIIDAEMELNAAWIRGRGAGPLLRKGEYAAALNAFGVEYRLRNNVSATPSVPTYHIQHVLTPQPPFPTRPAFQPPSIFPVVE